VTNSVNIKHCKWWNSCIRIRNTPYLFWIWVETKLAPNQEICVSICTEYRL